MVASLPPPILRLAEASEPPDDTVSDEIKYSSDVARLPPALCPPTITPLLVFEPRPWPPDGVPNDCPADWLLVEIVYLSTVLSQVVEKFIPPAIYISDDVPNDVGTNL